jgi:16S rRNA processing protein RimM
MYTQIGFLGKFHGLKGELKLSVEEKFADDFNVADVVFVKTKGQYAPFFIESVRGENTPIIKFEDVNTKEAAANIQHQPFFLRDSDITLVEADETEMELQYQHCQGFVVIDETLGELGMVQSVEEFPQQEMAVITYKENEVLIPLNEFMIVNIDENQKVIRVDLPEGLLEI